MESVITFLAILATVAVLGNFVAAWFDYKVKDEMAYLLNEIMNGSRPQNIILTEGQTKAIAKIVKEMMDEK